MLSSAEWQIVMRPCIPTSQNLTKGRFQEHSKQSPGLLKARTLIISALSCSSIRIALSGELGQASLRNITTPLMARQLAPLWGRAERPSSGTFLLSSLTYKPTLFGKNLLRLPRKLASQHVGRTHSQAAVVKCSALLRFTQHSLNHPPQINLNGSALPPL